MEQLIIGVVGPCAAGKSTLIAGLKKHNLRTKHIAQEHSGVADMWQRLSKPDILIYLHVSYPFTIRRRQLNWTENEYNEQLYRLRHAKEHADLMIDTDAISAAQVLSQALAYLKSVGHEVSSE